MSKKLVEHSAKLLKVLQKWNGGSVKFDRHPTMKGRLDVTLDRPEKGNCLSGRMMQELRLGSEVSIAIKSRISVESEFLVDAERGDRTQRRRWFILLRSRPRFDQRCECHQCECVYLNGRVQLSDANLGVPMFEFMSSALHALHSSPAVSVALIRGHCLGGATEICAAADIRIAHTGSKIGFLQSKLGIVPSWGGASYLENIIGRSKALYVMSSASVLAADDALRLGWLDFVYQTDEEAENYIGAMAKKEPALIHAQKEMLNAVRKSKESERDVLQKVWSSEVHKSALQKQLAAVVKR